MNIASLWKLPVIYVCENNIYNEYTHNSETTAGDILLRGPAFGVESHKVDGQDVRAVYAITQKLVERARNGEGPSILFCDTYRFHGHHVGDIAREYYRSKQEEQTWKTDRDPVTTDGNGFSPRKALPIARRSPRFRPKFRRSGCGGQVC